MGRTDLFSGDTSKVWTIPAGVDFLGSLASTLVTHFSLKTNPAALADTLIYVPNRRSARALVMALYKAADGATFLPPDVRALGDLESDEPPHGAEEALTDLGPALSSSRRLGALSTLVAKYYSAQGIDVPPTSAIAAARELGRLLDSAALAGVDDWSTLPDLVADTELATHWELSVKFLEIVTNHWPGWLAANSATEPFERRMIVARTIAQTLTNTPPSTPVIIAGSTGATPATRILMNAITRLPAGLVILPALDQDGADEMWAEITPVPEEGIAGEPDHPQFSLARTLSTLGMAASDVPIWPGSAPSEATRARAKLVYESLTPAGQTANWLDRLSNISAPQSEAEFTKLALKGFAIIEAADEADEALLAALSLRESLETPGQTAALVTPDATLARQVVALLKRWGVNVPQSGGIPLGRTNAGSLCLLAMDWALDTGHPVAIAALLKHPSLSFERAEIEALETGYLRGARVWGDIDELIAVIPVITEAKKGNRHTRLPDGTEAAALSCLTRLQARAHKVKALGEAGAVVEGPDAIADLTGLLDGLFGDETSAWTGQDGQATSRLLEAAGEVTGSLGAMPPRALADILTSLAAGMTVQTGAPEHPRLNIWGPLEARLQHVDRLVLAGLNETVWPEPAQVDAFLPRRFRAGLGLPAPEERLGLAAHDFAQLATAPDVTLLHSARRDDAPAIPSRWLLRLKTLCEGALGKDGTADHLAPPADRDPRLWAAHLTRDILTVTPKTVEPRPNPPVSSRPTSLSVTRIDTLQRDPYAIYAGNILKLKKLASLNEPPGVRERGTAIHRALELFDLDPRGEQTQGKLLERLLKELRAAGEPEHLVLARRATYEAISQEYFVWWKTRKPNLSKIWAEAFGSIELSIAGTPFKLTGQADRVEKLTSGHYAIIDFKTGAGKKRKQIEAGFEQQLPLLALIARDGTLTDQDGTPIPAAPVSEFGYVEVRSSFDAKPITNDPLDAETLTDTARDNLIELISAFRAPEAEFLSAPRVLLKSKYAGDFDRLARRAEWANDIAGEDG